MIQSTNQFDHGYFTPIVAYSEIEDRFLILDIYYGIFWIKTKCLFNVCQKMSKDS